MWLLNQEKKEVGKWPNALEIPADAAWSQAQAGRKRLA
jgi:hypothetical protein